jgi:hypothetical protein
MKDQSGQSMVEFAVGVSVLALLVMGALTIGAMQEIDRRTVSAAREISWRESWRPREAVTQAQVQSLHAASFSGPGAGDPVSGEELVARADLAVVSTSQRPSGVAGSATQVLLSPLRVASGFLGAQFDLAGETLTGGSVQVRIAPVSRLPAPFNELDLQWSVPFALLGDAWHAAGPAHVRQRAGGLAPTHALQGLQTIWRPLRMPAGILEPSLRQLCLGVIEPDRVPEDRLGPGSTPALDRCP